MIYSILGMRRGERDNDNDNNCNDNSALTFAPVADVDVLKVNLEVFPAHPKDSICPLRLAVYVRMISVLPQAVAGPTGADRSRSTALRCAIESSLRTVFLFARSVASFFDLRVDAPFL